MRMGSCCAVLLLVITTCSPVAQAQWEEVPAASFWSSAYVMGGGSSADGLDLFLGDFMLLAPGSAMLSSDLAGYSIERGWFIMDRPGAWGAMVGMRPFRRVDRPGPELRMGVQYAGGNLADLRYTRRDRTRVDTLVSPTTGAVAYVDSVRWSSYDMVFSGERLGVDVSLIFRLEGRSRWHLYGGAGFGMGATLNATTRLEHRIEVQVDHPGTSSSWSESATTERYQAASGAWVALALPVGLGFRLARKGDFLSRMDLFLESRPTTLWRGLGPLGTRTTFGAQGFFGLRVRLDP